MAVTTVSRQAAWALFTEWTASESVRAHVLAVEAGMRADYLGVPRRTPLARALYAVDELSGFVAACARVRPDGIHGLTPKSVKKKLKAPSFAAGVDREGVRRGAEGLGVDFDQHVARVIAAMEERAPELGLEPGDAAAVPPADEV